MLSNVLMFINILSVMLKIPYSAYQKCMQVGAYFFDCKAILLRQPIF